MTISPTRQSFARAKLPRTRQSALILALIAGIFASAANAQVLVTDTVAISAAEEGFKSQLAQTISQYTKQGLQYTKQIAQYQMQIQQYEQMVMRVHGLGKNISLSPSNLKRIEEPEISGLVDQGCPSPDGRSVVGQLVTSIASSFRSTDAITSSQQKICANIVMLQVDKYNRSVEIINQLNKFGGTLNKLNDLANAVNNVGNANNTSAQAGALSATLAKSMHEWKLAIQGDDNLIKALSSQQAILARVALNGKPGIVGEVIQGAAFAKEFH